MGLGLKGRIKGGKIRVNRQEVSSWRSKFKVMDGFIAFRPSVDIFGQDGRPFIIYDLLFTICYCIYLSVCSVANRNPRNLRNPRSLQLIIDYLLLIIVFALCGLYGCCGHMNGFCLHSYGYFRYNRKRM